jgi:hypothetical protein
MKFKDQEVEARFTLMHPVAQELAKQMDQWSQEHYGIELTLTATTSTREEDKALGRVSDTHRTGRAFDVRTRDLPESLIAEMLAHFRFLYPKLGAFTGKQHQLIVYKPHGTGPHLHVQIKRNVPDSLESNHGKT